MSAVVAETAPPSEPEKQTQKAIPKYVCSYLIDTTGMGTPSRSMHSQTACTWTNLPHAYATAQLQWLIDF